MYAIPTTTVSILRGTTTDTYGDVHDSATVSASGVLASILEQSSTPITPADSRTQQVRTVTGRVPNGTSVQVGDRIKDEQTNQIYIIDSVTTVQNPLTRVDVRMDLRKITQTA